MSENTRTSPPLRVPPPSKHQLAMIWSRAPAGALARLVTDGGDRQCRATHGGSMATVGLLVLIRMAVARGGVSVHTATWSGERRVRPDKGLVMLTRIAHAITVHRVLHPAALALPLTVEPV
jgi:hypothetical protein